MDLSNKEIEEIDNEVESESRKKIEAALFLAGKYMSIQELVALTEVNPLLLKKILSDLQGEYKDSGIELVNQSQMWKMDVSQDYTWMVNKLATGSSEFTKAEQETLAIIAYKQPMKQSVLVKIRGNKAYDHIKRFVDMGLINKKRAGHTSELTLNDNFHDYFSLSGQEELIERGKVERTEIVEDNSEDVDVSEEDVKGDSISINEGEKGNEKVEGG